MPVDYNVSDWLDVADEYRGQAALVHLDANWAAPARYAGRGVDYVTYPVTEAATEDFPDSELDRDEIDTSRTIAELLDAAWAALESGGWLLLDADSYAARRFEAYLCEQYGEVRVQDANGRPYRGGGFRKRGAVYFESVDGSPDCSGTGQYGAEAGHPVLFAHKGKTDRTWSASVRQPARRPRWTEPTDEYDQGTVKPVEPYKRWIEGIVEPGELVLAPCAGSGPALIAAEQLWGRQARAVGVDVSATARAAWGRRRDHLVDGMGVEASQTRLATPDGGDDDGWSG